jgi:hypothetical protein
MWGLGSGDSLCRDGMDSIKLSQSDTDELG